MRSVFSIAAFIFHVVVDAACLTIVTWPIGFLLERGEILDLTAVAGGTRFRWEPDSGDDLGFETEALERTRRVNDAGRAEVARPALSSEGRRAAR